MKKIFLITGSSKGIGFETARLLGKEGHTVIINSRSSESLDAAEAKLKSEGIDCYKAVFDVCDEQALSKGIGDAGKHFGHIDSLVHCAGGLGGRMSVEEMTTDFYRNVMALNVDSSFLAVREALPFLKKAENPSIVLFSSIAAWSGGGPGASIYATSKGAVDAMTRGFAKDLAGFGIRVNCVSPGTIDTPFHAPLLQKNPGAFDAIKENIVLKRIGKPEEVASVVKFLTGPDSSFMTGEIVQVNGGQLFL